MAREEINFIRPQEVYDVGDNKSKVRYRGYNGKEHEIELAENLGDDVAEVINDTFVPNEGGNVVFTDKNQTEHELITEDGFAGALDTALAKAQVIETTWQELKDKRDNGQLIAGSLYRITDYNCTTTQENTRSAGHQFDIVLLALSEDKLAEEGWAMMNESNIYDVTFADGVTKKCWLYLSYEEEGELSEYNVVDVSTLLGVTLIESGPWSVNEENKTITITDYASTALTNPDMQYNYFQNSNLSAWKVWYCLDNDKSRFAWAMDVQPASVIMTDGREENSYIRTPEGDANNKYCWVRSSNAFWTDSQTPQNGDSIYNNSAEIISGCSIVSYSPSQEGRGVIYRLIDEFNNDVAYDFKNIQFVLSIDTSTGYYDENGTNTYVYSLNAWIDGEIMDASIIGNTLTNDVDYIDMVANNTIKTIAPSLTNGYKLPFNIILTSNEDGDGYYGANFISFSGNSRHNSINSPCSNVNFIKDCFDNRLVNSSYVILLSCAMSSNGLDDHNIYIGGKKVLTEE